MVSHVDGNALAGPLSEIFEIDVTAASVRCQTCGDTSVLARAMVYEKPHALIARCSACDGVLMIVLQKHDATEIDLSGVAWLGIPR
jgi:NAD-dependent SIR2 family protein deacetylase